MSEKFRNIIALLGLLCIAGIMLEAFLPDSVLPDRSITDAASADVGYSESESSNASYAEETSSSAEAEESGQESGSVTPYYYYNALAGQEQIIYEQIYESITSREDAVLETLDDTVVDKIYQCVMNDHPEIFYSASYTLEKQLRGIDVVKLTFTPGYHMTEEEQESCQQGINAYVERCISQAPAGGDEYATVKYVYEYIIEHTKYVLNCENNQNICSVFLNGQSVCQGYAKAAQYILMRMGVEITMAYGRVENDFHSWNLVRVDGDYYYMDPTWGDAGYVRPGSASAKTDPRSVNYEYFLITTRQIAMSHTIDNVVPLPACISTRNNYYVREGLYLNVYDETAISEIFEQAKSSGAGYVTFMCCDSELYGQVKNSLITDELVFQYLDSSRSVSYSCNDDLYTLIFWIE